MSINRYMDKEDVVHICNGILLSYKKNEMPFAVTWMQQDIIIVSEVSQKEKDKYHDITYMWNLKTGHEKKNKK